MVAVCPRTGRHLREATVGEVEAYDSRNAGKGPFARPVKLGEVLVDEDTGPGRSHVPGRFLRN